MLLFLIPSRFEASELFTRLEGRRNFRVGQANCASGTLAGRPATVAIIGMGSPHAPKRAQAVIHAAHENKAQPPKAVFLCGFAGALCPKLKRSDIFVTAGANHLLHRLPEAERPAEAPLHTAGALVATAKAKAALHTLTGAWLVDMEQAYIAPMAEEAKLPFVGVRIVSDEAHEELPHELLGHSYDQQRGKETPLRLAAHLTRNPFKTTQLVSFVRPLPAIRNRMTERLHTWLRLAGPELFA